MSPYLLRWKLDESGQADSSSWKFLDQNEQPGIECFQEINNQVQRNSLSVDIVPRKPELSISSKISLTQNDEQSLKSILGSVHDADTLSISGEDPVSNDERNSSDIIKSYIKDLTKKDDSLLGRTVLQLIVCTKDSAVDDPKSIIENQK